MKNVSSCLFLGLALCVSATAAERVAIRPISNPVFFDSPGIGLQVHPLFMHQSLSKSVKVDHPALGKTTLPVGGDFQLYALQFEVPLSEHVSLIAVKDGYIDFNPDETLSQEVGIADVAAGLKWAFLRGEDTVASVRLVYEIALGDDDVAQGNGDGAFNPGVSFQTFLGSAMVAGTLGAVVPVDSGAESSMMYSSWHVSMPVTSYLIPLVELNYWRVLDAGEGESQFTAHVDGAVPAVLQFEGGDLINMGASHAEDNEDFASLALGFRVPATENLDFGLAYEFPLTDDEETLMDYRVTFDVVIKL